MKTCPFCGYKYVRSDTTHVVNTRYGKIYFETDIAYIECPCGATYCPERLRVNHARSD